MRLAKLKLGGLQQPGPLTQITSELSRYLDTMKDPEAIDPTVCPMSAICEQYTPTMDTTTDEAISNTFCHQWNDSG
jgi:hypothetical protein